MGGETRKLGKELSNRPVKSIEVQLMVVNRIRTLLVGQTANPDRHPLEWSYDLEWSILSRRNSHLREISWKIDRRNPTVSVIGKGPYKRGKKGLVRPVQSFDKTTIRKRRLLSLKKKDRLRRLGIEINKQVFLTRFYPCLKVVPSVSEHSVDVVHFVNVREVVFLLL